MNWKAGDRFVFVTGKSGTSNGGKHNWLLGTQGTIVSPTAERPGRVTVDADFLPYTADDEWGGWSVHPSWLKPIDDGNEKTTWGECVWKPKELVTLEMSDD